MLHSLSLVDKRAVITQLVSGHTFADVGGLFSTHNEMISVALKAGATAASMIDAVPLSSPLWKNFHAHVRQETQRTFEVAEADVCREGFAEAVGKFDFVHSGGVISHIQSPVPYLANLEAISAKYLMISSVTVPEKLRYEAGELDLSGGRFLCARNLNFDQRKIIEEHLSFVNLEQMQVPDNYDNRVTQASSAYPRSWWWIFTVESLRRLLETAGLEVLSIGESWPRRANSFLCRPKRRRPSTVRAEARDEPTISHPAGPALTNEMVAERVLLFARQTFSRDTARWASGITYEAAFWENQVRTGGGKWREDFQLRISAAPPLDHRMEILVARLGRPLVSILDVGAGPVTTIGTISKHAALAVDAVDPLASLYSLLLKMGNITPAVETKFAPAEALSYFLPSQSYDIVHCRNALDHSVNPLMGILQMLQLLRSDGALYLRHHTNEAESAAYTDFHQYNFEVRGSRFLIWNQEHTIDVNDWLLDIADVETWPDGLGAEVVLRLRDGVPPRFEFDETEMAVVGDNIRLEVTKAAGIFGQRVEA